MHKLCYVLPRFDPDTATHFLHLYELLEGINGRIDLRLICAAKSQTRPNVNATVTLITTRYGPLKALKYVSALTAAYVRGYRSYYVHYHTLSALWASLLCRLLGGQTHVWVCVQHERYFAPRRPRWSDIKRKLLSDLPIRLTYRWAQRIVVCSSYMKRHVVETFGVPEERLRVFENWVSLARYRPMPDKRASVRLKLGVADDAPVVLYAHTLGEHKGAHRLAALARRVLEACPETHFVVAGDGPYRWRLEQEVEAADLRGRVHVLGPVPNRRVPELMAAADVLINPATVEEFGRVLLEAMACGLPFVSTDGGGGVLAFTTPAQQRYVTRTGDLDGFADRVVMLLKSRDEREALAEDGLRHVQGYSLEVAAERFVGIVNEA